MFPVVLAALTVVAITLSPHAAYSDAVRMGQIQRTPSAEILKLHAGNQMMMASSLDHPDFPAFVVEPPPAQRS
jgi:hypothetical protein